MDMHRQLLMRKEDQISRHKRGEDFGHYANGNLNPVSSADIYFKLSENGFSNCFLFIDILSAPPANRMQGDRDRDPQSDDHAQGFSNFSQSPLDCNLMLMSSAIQNPTALGTTPFRPPVP
jgi:hypothetical protein